MVCAQIDDMKTSLMEGQAGTNALSEIMARGGAEAASIMQKRFMTALDELKGFVGEAAPSSTSVSILKSPDCSQNSGNAQKRAQCT
jgi:hypothetical protein